MAYLSLKNVVKEFITNNKPLRVLDGVSFDVKKGEFITLFGPNGCGKTTLLNILAEFEKLSSGKIEISGKPINGIKSYLVFQNSNDSLFNWMTVKNNLKFALNGKDTNKVDEILAKLKFGKDKLSNFEKFYPYQLSGGLRQLAVLGRAFLYRPDLLLLDEPFSSLDYRTSIELEDELLQTWEKNRLTVIFISHNIDEAVYLADKIVVLSNRPTKVNKIIPVNLPRPRKQEVKLSKDFQKIKQEVLNNFGDT